MRIKIINKNYPLIQLYSTIDSVASLLKKQLNEMQGIKLLETLKLTFKKTTIDADKNESKIIFKTAYFNSKAKTIINENEIIEGIQTSNQEILDGIAVWLSKASGWTVESIDVQYINTVKYKPLKGSSYIELPPELRNPAKGLINLQNNDNECFRWCHIRYSNPQEIHLGRIKKCNQEHIKNSDYTNVTFPVAQKDYRKIEIMNNINISVFGYEKQEPYPDYISKEQFNDMLNLLLITKRKEQRYVLIKDFNKFMYNQTKHKERNHFCMYCLQCFRYEKPLLMIKKTALQLMVHRL